ncbi:KH domain-containing, RNA-binding, signal transduction-associated protein 2 isoform X2 [Daktulosphaira vitifoliae]|nr:KH domain-containing, RNA-binding, signal transduction-associated protein 2 isoform X2 [Daktulosphaira vitifoliae]XP_050545661.1 KH domain-containing, RNA-binding, signal transduction-associated protein 2 isoform X2 [Daktulosphaira vitifoliae]
MSSNEVNDSSNGDVATESKPNEYISSLVKEKYALDSDSHPNAMKLIDNEISRAQSSNVKPESTYLDINSDKPIRLTTKIMVPVKEFPRFNFVGKLLGPKGNSLKRLQEDTMTKMAILGKGSMRNKEKEDEMRNSLNPKFSHLADELHVQVTAYAPPAEAYARVAYALAELRKFLIPDHNDQIAQEQAREMQQFGGVPPVRHPGPIIHAPPPVIRPMPPQPVRMPRAPVPGKAKVLSILDRARSAMEGNNAFPGNGGYGDSATSHYSHYDSGYGGVATYNGGGNDEYYSGNSFAQDVNPSSSARGWKNYNTGGNGGVGPSKQTGNQGGRYGGRNAPYARQK